MASFDGRPDSLALRKFSFVTSCLEQTKHVWSHVSNGDLYAVFYSTVRRGSTDLRQTQRRLKIHHGTEILEDLVLDELLLQVPNSASPPDSQVSLSSPEQFLIIVKQPLLAIRYRLDTDKMRRIQLNFVDENGYSTALAELGAAGLPFRGKGDPSERNTQSSQSITQVPNIISHTQAVSPLKPNTRLAYQTNRYQLRGNNILTPFHSATAGLAAQNASQSGYALSPEERQSIQDLPDSRLNTIIPLRYNRSSQTEIGFSSQHLVRNTPDAYEINFPELTKLDVQVLPPKRDLPFVRKEIKNTSTTTTKAIQSKVQPQAKSPTKSDKKPASGYDALQKTKRAPNKRQRAETNGKRQVSLRSVSPAAIALLPELPRESKKRGNLEKDNGEAKLAKIYRKISTSNTRQSDIQSLPNPEQKPKSAVLAKHRSVHSKNSVNQRSSKSRARKMRTPASTAGNKVRSSPSSELYQPRTSLGVSKTNGSVHSDSETTADLLCHETAGDASPSGIAPALNFRNQTSILQKPTTLSTFNPRSMPDHLFAPIQSNPSIISCSPPTAASMLPSKSTRASTRAATCASLARAASKAPYSAKLPKSQPAKTIAINSKSKVQTNLQAYIEVDIEADHGRPEGEDEGDARLVQLYASTHSEYEALAVDENFRAFVDAFVRRHCGPNSNAIADSSSPSLQLHTPPSTEEQDTHPMSGLLLTTDDTRSYFANLAIAGELDAEVRRIVCEPDFERLCLAVEASCRKLGLRA